MQTDSYQSESSDVPARLLVCDDSPIERLALARFLQQIGYEVSEASDGAAAIAHIKQKHVDLVLLDLQMVGHDGFEALAYIQEHHAALPVILLSGMPLDQIQHKMGRLPKQELPPLLLKPVDPDQLLQIVALQLSGELPMA
jgi:two-component system capsular synthesis sensor histidine kinase RcsC